MDAGTDSPKAAQQVRVVAERQIGIETVDDVKLGERLIGALPQFVPGFLERHRVRLGHAWLQPRERTEQTARFADVGWLEAQVVVEIRTRAVTLLALAVRKPAHRQQVRSVEQTHAVLEREPFTRLQ